MTYPHHPGVAGILKTRDPLGPHSLALAEAFLSPLQTAGFADREAGLAFFLLVDYTIGFAVSSPRTSVNSSGSAIRRLEPSCTSSSDRCPPTASQPWSPSASTSGSTTATSGSPPASRCWSTGWNTHGTRPTDRRSATTDHDHQDHPRTSTPTADNQRGYAKEGDPSSINAHCGSCDRELLLGQLVQPSDGFRCPVCGFTFAPAYATVAPGVAARVMAAQAALVTALAELGSMTGDRLRLDRATVVDPVANALPQVKAENPLWPAETMPTAGPAALRTALNCETEFADRGDRPARA